MRTEDKSILVLVVIICGFGTSLPSTFGQSTTQSTCPVGQIFYNGKCWQCSPGGCGPAGDNLAWQVYQLSGKFFGRTYPQTVDKVFNIPYKIINGSIEKIALDAQSLSLIIDMKSESDGKLQIILPREIIDAKTGNMDDPFVVLIDGREVDYNESSQSICSRTLSIEFPKDSNEIEIIATWIPENPPPTSTVPPLQIFAYKHNYTRGEPLTISGCTSLRLGEEKINIDILNPDGKIYETASEISNIDGTFSSTFALDNASTVNGIYTVKTTAGNYTATQTFVVVPEFPATGMMVFALAITLIMITKFLTRKVRGTAR